jgi:hypothetical protein
MDSPPAFSSNPYGSFDPSQWSNPYSLFNSGALPWPSSYVGAPTDAMGRPIASYQPPAAQPPAPGVTLNSSPASSGSAGILNAMGMGGFAGQAAGKGVSNDQLLALAFGLGPNQIAAINSAGGQQQTAAPQAAAPAAPNNYNAVLAALANPGKVTTPGATVPQGSPYQPGPGVLQNFLANWSPASSGPGAGFQQGFAKALKR